MWTARNKLHLSPKLKLGVGRGVSKHRFLKATGTVCLAITLLLTANAIRLLISAGQDTTYAPQVLGATDQAEGTSYVTPYSDYTVRTGDTLFNISQQINISWTTLAELNNLEPPFTLKPGQVIKIPNNK